MLTPIFSWQMVKEIAIHVKVQHTEKDKLRLGIVIAALHAVEGTDPWCVGTLLHCFLYDLV